MEFCSKYGYNYGFDGSDEDEVEQESSTSNVKSKKKVRQADTNIISIKVDQLVECNKVDRNKPIECNKCNACLSHLSVLKKETNEKMKWICEFCFEENQIDDTNLITGNDVTFLVEPEKSGITNISENTNMSGEIVSLDSNYFTLCIDVSGSMGTGLKLKENENPTNKSNFGFGNYSNTVTRLDAIKCACIENLKKLKLEQPNKKVSLVTFESVINYYGDCVNQNSLTISGQSYSDRNLTPDLITEYANDQEMKSEENVENNESLEKLLRKNGLLSSIEDIRKIARLTESNLTGISNSFEKLEEKIKTLTHLGGTALGPALLYSICLNESPGSQICLLTDGAANIGFGSLHDNDEHRIGEKFYDEVANYSKERGIIINVITVEGTDCKLAVLGKLANITNGNLNIVDPLNFGDELKSILENRIKATNVKIKLIVNHKYIYIRDDELNKLQTQDSYDKDNLDELKKSIVTKDLGAAKNFSEVFFEYGIRRVKNEDKSIITELPFQIQIEYTTPNGAKMKRVLTKTQKFTTSRDDAEKNIAETQFIFANTIQKMATQAINSNVSGSNLFGTTTTTMANRLNLAQPAAFGAGLATFSSMSPGQAFACSTDINANNIYNLTKVSSTFMN